MSIWRTLAVGAAAGLFFATGVQAADGLAPAYLRQQEAGIRSNLEAYYRFDPQIDTSAISFDVSGDVVTLRGTVADRRTKNAAVLAAQNTNGVAKVINRLEVREFDPPPSVLAIGTRPGPTGVNLAETPR